MYGSSARTARMPAGISRAPAAMAVLRALSTVQPRPMRCPAGARYLLVESGANDPEFNLRREQAVIQRLDGAGETVFVSLLEPHGEYDAVSEAVVASTSRISALEHRRGDAADVVLVTLTGGRRVVIAVADDTEAATRHSATVAGRRLEWTGPVGRLDLAGSDKK